MVSDLQAKLRFQGQTKLPRWMGSAFRGGLGHQLKGILCPSIQEECSICSEKEECFYYRVYEVKESKRGHAPPPKPLIVVPPFFGKEMNWRRGGDIHLRILLLGEEGIRHAPHVIFSLIQLGMIGLGSERAYGMNKFSDKCNQSRRDDIQRIGDEDTSSQHRCQRSGSNRRR